jgi:hypothetical protein
VTLRVLPVVPAKRRGCSIRGSQVERLEVSILRTGPRIFAPGSRKFALAATRTRVEADGKLSIRLFRQRAGNRMNSAMGKI